jgi:hypothetical protein
MSIDIPILDGEEWWSSEAIDDTDSIIKSLLELTKSSIELSIRFEDAKQLHSELSLHNNTHNIALYTDKWISFCNSLSQTELAEMAIIVQNNLTAYVSKHLSSRI